MHEIEFLTFSSRKTPKGIVEDCAKIADRNGDYKGQIRGIRLKDKVFDDYDSARGWIIANDDGWYDNLGVKYKDGNKTKWLVKIEYHC